jgi:flavodoxin
MKKIVQFILSGLLLSCVAGNGFAQNTKSKILVVYYSASGKTESVAKTLSKYFNADIFEVTPTTVYSNADLDWTDNSSRVCKEYKNASLRDVKLVSTSVPNWDSYDTVFVGYPIWWGIAAWPLTTFVKTNNFSGKKVIPFCTAISSGLGNSGRLLEQDAKSGKWESGKRFRSGVAASEVEDWAKSLGVK